LPSPSVRLSPRSSGLLMGAGSERTRSVTRRVIVDRSNPFPSAGFCKGGFPLGTRRRVYLVASRALIAVPSMDEPREFVRSWRLVSLPDSAPRALHEACAAA